MGLLNINRIDNGIVIDHIKAGLGVKLYYYLDLDKSPFTVALITNAESEKHDKKDILKIENILDLDYTVLGLIDRNITINIVENGIITSKSKLNLPQKVEDVICCKNPRCITSIEKQIPHVFYLKNVEKGQYSCAYCEDMVERFEI